VQKRCALPRAVVVKTLSTLRTISLPQHWHCRPVRSSPSRLGGSGEASRIRAGLLGSLVAGVGEAVAGGAGFDDVAAEGEAVHDRGAESWVGEGLGSAGEAVVAGDRDGVLFFAFGEDLEEQLGAAAVEFHVAEFIELCGYPHRSTYAEPATMPRTVVGVLLFGCVAGRSAPLGSCSCRHSGGLSAA